MKLLPSISKKFFSFMVVAVLGALPACTFVSVLAFESMFGNSSRGSTPHILLNTPVLAIAAQSTDKYLSAELLGDRILVSRFNSDGTPDITFNTAQSSNVREINLGGNPINIGLAVDASDSIYVGADVRGSGFNTRDYKVTKLTANGNNSLFGTDGIARIADGASGNAVYKFTVDSQGRIVSVGTGSDSACRVSRLRTNGALDTGFGTNGQFTINFGAGLHFCRSVIVQPDDKILFTGFIQTGEVIASPPAYNLVRLDSTGNRDISFEATGSGVVTLNAAEVPNIYILSNFNPSIRYDSTAGRIYLASSVYRNGGTWEDIAIKAFGLNGSTATDFGNNGIAVYDLGTQYDLLSSIEGINGRLAILAKTHGDDANSTRVVVYDIESDGNVNLDTGIGGQLIVDTDGTRTIVDGVTTTGGNLIIAGSLRYAEETSSRGYVAKVIPGLKNVD